MKKIICLILALIMVASFMVACKGDRGDSTTKRSHNNISGDGPDIDVDGNQDKVRIYTRDAAGATDGDYILLEFNGTGSTNQALRDAVKSRNEAVEGWLNVKLEIISELGGMDNAQAWSNKVKNAATADKNDLFDICALYASQGSPLATVGAFLDVNLLPQGEKNALNLNKKYWNQILKDDLNIDGSLFMLCGDMSLTSTAFSQAIFYNKNMFNEYLANNADFNNKYSSYKLERTEEEIEAGYNMLHDIVDGGGWTMQTFSDIASRVYVDNGTPGKNDGDIFGLSIDIASSPLDAWVAAFDIKIVEKNAQTGARTLAFENPSNLSRATQAWNMSKELLTANRGVHAFEVNKEGAVKEFGSGNSLFTMARLCDAESFRDTADWEYGILPLPKYDVQQLNYYTLPHNAYSLIAVAANLERNREELIACALELLAYESSVEITPTYYEVILKGQYSDKQVDADMYDIILGNIRLDFGAVFSTASLSGISNNFRYTDESFSKTWQSKKSVYTENLTKLVDALKEQSRLQRQYS